MDLDINKKFEEQDRKLQEIFVSVEKTRKYFLWSAIAQLALVLLPLVVLMFAIPFLLSALNKNLEGLL